MQKKKAFKQRQQPNNKNNQAPKTRGTGTRASDVDDLGHPPPPLSRANEHQPTTGEGGGSPPLPPLPIDISAKTAQPPPPSPPTCSSIKAGRARRGHTYTTLVAVTSQDVVQTQFPEIKKTKDALARNRRVPISER